MTMNYNITGYCSIRNQVAMVDDRLEHYEENFYTFADLIKSLYKKEEISYPKFFKMDGLSKLGFLTAEMLLKQKEKGKYQGTRVGMILSNSASSLDTDMAFHETIRDRRQYFPSPSVFVYTLPNIVIGEICIRNKFKGENTFLISEKFDSGLLYTNIREALDHGRMDVCIGGWVDLLRERYESLLFIVEKETNISPDTEQKKIEFCPEEIEKLYLKI